MTFLRHIHKLPITACAFYLKAFFLFQSFSLFSWRPFLTEVNWTDECTHKLRYFQTQPPRPNQRLKVTMPFVSIPINIVKIINLMPQIFVFKSHGSCMGIKLEGSAFTTFSKHRNSRKSFKLQWKWSFKQSSRYESSSNLFSESLITCCVGF